MATEGSLTYLVKVEPQPGSGEFNYFYVRANNLTEAWDKATKEWYNYGPASRVISVKEVK